MKIPYVGVAILAVEISVGLIRLLQVNKLYEIDRGREKEIPINKKKKLNVYFLCAILFALFYIGCWLYFHKSIVLFIFGTTIFVVLIDNLYRKIIKERTSVGSE